MRFVVSFRGLYDTALDFTNWAVELPAVGGLGALTEARKIIPNISPKDVMAVDTENINPCVSIPEDLAVKTGYFSDRSIVYVTVGRGSLSRFYSIDHSIVDTKYSGVLPRIMLYWRLDVDSLLAAWEKAGFPLRWMYSLPGTPSEVTPKRKSWRARIQDFLKND